MQVIGDGVLRFSLVVLYRFGVTGYGIRLQAGSPAGDKDDVAQAQRRADMISSPYVL